MKAHKIKQGKNNLDYSIRIVDSPSTPSMDTAQLIFPIPWGPSLASRKCRAGLKCRKLTPWRVAHSQQWVPRTLGGSTLSYIYYSFQDLVPSRTEPWSPTVVTYPWIPHHGLFSGLHVSFPLWVLPASPSK